MRDAYAGWREGIPAIVLVHEPFATLARAQCQALGAKDPLVLVYKQDAPARDTVDETVAKAAEVAAGIVRLLGSRSR